jgi:hypothetical protein
MSKDIRKLKKTSAMLDLVHKSKGSIIAPREVLDNITRLAPEAVTVLEELMASSKADSVRLKAALEILALSGISKETKISLKTEMHDMSDDEVDTRLSDLLRTAGSIVIEGDSKDITPRETVSG